MYVSLVCGLCMCVAFDRCKCVVHVCNGASVCIFGRLCTSFWCWYLTFVYELL